MQENAIAKSRKKVIKFHWLWKNKNEIQLFFCEIQAEISTRLFMICLNFSDLVFHVADIYSDNAKFFSFCNDFFNYLIKKF